MKQLRLNKMFALTFECDGEDKAKQLLEKLGIKASVLKKVEGGELSIDDAVTDWETDYEAAAKKRLEKEIKDAVVPEIYAAFYKKNEEVVCKVYGLSHDDYKDVDPKKRLVTILEDGKKKLEDKVKETEEKFKGVDVEKVKAIEQKYQKMIDDANAEKLEAIEKANNAERDALTKVKGIKNEIAMKEAQLKFFGTAVKNPALTQKQMESILKAEMVKMNIDIDTEDDKGRVFVIDKEGKRLKSKQSVSENMTIDELFLNIAAEYDFERKSNAGEGSGTGIDLGKAGEGASGGIHPDALKKLKERGLIK